RTSRSMPSSARRRPKRLTRPSTSIAGGSRGDTRCSLQTRRIRRAADSARIRRPDPATSGARAGARPSRRWYNRAEIMTPLAAPITAGLFLLTALAEIGGCFLVYLVLRQGRSTWLLAPAALLL